MQERKSTPNTTVNDSKSVPTFYELPTRLMQYDVIKCPNADTLPIIRSVPDFKYLIQDLNVSRGEPNLQEDRIKLLDVKTKQEINVSIYQMITDHKKIPVRPKREFAALSENELLVINALSKDEKDEKTDNYFEICKIDVSKPKHEMVTKLVTIEISKDLLHRLSLVCFDDREYPMLVSPCKSYLLCFIAKANVSLDGYDPISMTVVNLKTLEYKSIADPLEPGFKKIHLLQGNRLVIENNYNSTLQLYSLDFSSPTILKNEKDLFHDVKTHTVTPDGKHWLIHVRDRGLLLCEMNGNNELIEKCSYYHDSPILMLSFSNGYFYSTFSDEIIKIDPNSMDCERIIHQSRIPADTSSLLKPCGMQPYYSGKFFTDSHMLSDAKRNVITVTDDYSEHSPAFLKELEAVYRGLLPDGGKDTGNIVLDYAEKLPRMRKT